MSAPRKVPITKDDLIRSNRAMLVLTSLFVLSRIAIQISRCKAFELTDFFLYFAFILFVTMWTCYLLVIPSMFRIYAVIDGQEMPYPTMKEDGAVMLRLIGAGQMCFYTLLFSVKMSLLTLYWKLVVGLHGFYTKIRWGIVTFCRVKYTTGKCPGITNEAQRVIFSLYFAYSVDVATDLAIMLLPIKLIWNLQMPRRKKAGIFLLFGSGFICIAFATLRVVQLGVDGRGRTTTPEPKWLLLWTVLECAMAIIIGSSPAFATLIRTRINTSKSPYNARGYNHRRSNDIRIKTIGSYSKELRRSHINPYWDDGHDSQEEFAKNAGRILVKTTVHQEEGMASQESHQKMNGTTWTVEMNDTGGTKSGDPRQ